MLKIGPTFGAELIAADCNNGVTWNEVTGVLTFTQHTSDDGLTDAQYAARAAAQQTVLATHDPSKTLAPPSVSNYQARTILIQQGLFTKADAAIRAADQTVVANQIALAAWDYANVFYRTDPLIASMAATLGLSSAQVDALFVAAAQFGA